ncbi:MAG: SRPBCC family protein [Candidatus Marinimicrobia bacterium]|nr:SRPBCC family protein [Candidatus Neomarinimicrobiota bacterium]MCF7903946.1 SRPBCC family protein [Candidatus Neomarinimicrobiota bacterium]
MVNMESVFIAQKPDVIWEFLEDVRNDVVWRQGITKAEWTSKPPYGAGSTGEHTHKQVGRLKWVITQYEPGNSFEFKHIEGALAGSTAFFRVQPENGGSRVDFQATFTGPLKFRFMLIFMGGMMRKSMKTDLQTLKNHLEKESHHE